MLLPASSFPPYGWLVADAATHARTHLLGCTRFRKPLQRGPQDRVGQSQLIDGAQAGPRAHEGRNLLAQHVNVVMLLMLLLFLLLVVVVAVLWAHSEANVGVVVVSSCF